MPLHKSLFGVPDGKGLPIGNYTSQFFANVYLNKLDQYAKRTLKCKHYFRYMDDVLILHSDQKHLRYLAREINNFLKINLKLGLHPKKTILQKTQKGINFLGYIIKPEYSLSRKRVIGNFKSKLMQMNYALRQAKNPEQIETIVRKAVCVINSYWGHFQHADCGNLKQKLHQKHFGELEKYLEKSENKKHFLIKNSVFPKK